MLLLYNSLLFSGMVLDRDWRTFKLMVFKYARGFIRDAVGRCKRTLVWHYNYACLRRPKVKGRLSVGRTEQERILQEMKCYNMSIEDLYIDTADYEDYMKNAGYKDFPDYYEGGKGIAFIEKSLEHYVAAKMLELSEDDVYIDIANCCSPVPEIYHKIYGCKVYRQDLVFPEGVHEDAIGGDASNMPVEDGFATKMALHCSFEHFEGDSDIRFIREAARVLRKGGRLCILPLYFSTRYAIQTNPAHLPIGGLAFEDDAVLYCPKDHDVRHGRYYDVPHFISRIINNLNELTLTMYVVKNAEDVDASCYLYFAALFEKK